jgi:hypothetical protein
VEASLPLAFLGYAALLCVFSLFFLLFGRIVHLKLSSLGKWPSLRVVGEMIFWPVLSLFSSVFGSQIYISSPTSD